MFNSQLTFNKKTYKKWSAILLLSSVFLVYLRCTSSTTSTAKTASFKLSAGGLWLCLHPESDIAQTTWLQKSPYFVRLKHPKKRSYCLQTSFLGFRDLGNGRTSPCFEIKDKALSRIDDLAYLARQKDTSLEVVNHPQRLCRPHKERVTYGL